MGEPNLVDPMSEAYAIWSEDDVRLRVLQPSEAVGEAWEVCRGYFEQAAIHAPYDLTDWDEVKELAATGKVLLIQVAHGPEVVAAVALELLTGRDGPALVVRWLGGSAMSTWIDLLYVALQDVGRAYKCSWIVVAGRVGWARELKRLGFNQYMVATRARVEQ